MSVGGRRRRRYRGPTYRGTIDEGRWIADEEESHGITGSTVHPLEVNEVSESAATESAATSDVDVSVEDDTGSPLPDSVEVRQGGWAGGGSSTSNSPPEDRGESGEE